MNMQFDCFLMCVCVCVCVGQVFDTALRFGSRVSIIVIDGWKGGAYVLFFFLESVQIVSEILVFSKNISINHLETKSYNM